MMVYKKYRSLRKSINQFGQELANIKQQLNLPDTTAFKLTLCADELFVNAIYHGNKLNPNKFVETIITTTNTTINVRIIDEGNGVSMENIPDPTNADNILKDRGRGIFIVKNYAEYIICQHNQRGFCVEIQLNITNNKL